MLPSRPSTGDGTPVLPCKRNLPPRKASPQYLRSDPPVKRSGTPVSRPFVIFTRYRVNFHGALFQRYHTLLLVTARHYSLSPILPALSVVGTVLAISTF